MRLIDGAVAIREDLPDAWTVSVTVPPGAGSSLDTGVQRLSAIQYVRDELRATLHDAATPAITIGGDCGVEIGAIEHALASTRDPDADTVVVWFDAHGDLNTPESSPSGAFAGMVLRTLLGDGPAELVPATPLRADRVILAGVRTLDDDESDFVTSSGITLIPAAELSGTTVCDAIRDSGATSVYIHIDLDVIDPAEFASGGDPEPFGVGIQQLIDTIVAVRTAHPLVGAGVTEFAPANGDAASDDLPSILRIIGALTRKL